MTLYLRSSTELIKAPADSPERSKRKESGEVLCIIIQLQSKLRFGALHQKRFAVHTQGCIIKISTSKYEFIRLPTDSPIRRDANSNFINNNGAGAFAHSRITHSAICRDAEITRARIPRA